MDDDHLLLDAATFAGRYANGALPDADPLEILTGLHLGLSPRQLDTLDGDLALRNLVRRHWDHEGVDPTLAAVASRADDLGRRHLALLRSLGYDPDAPDLGRKVDQVVWLALSTAPQALATKGPDVADTRRWTLWCSPLECHLVVTRQGDGYDVAFVPEVTPAGTGDVWVRWDDDSEDRASVDLTPRQLVRCHFEALGRTLVAVAMAVGTGRGDA